MKLEPLERFDIAGQAGIYLTDQQNEPAEIRGRSGRLGTNALRELGKRLNPGTKICADRPALAERWGPGCTHNLGEITFVVWRDETILGCFFLHDIAPEVDTLRSLVVRAELLPMFETRLEDELADARLTGRIMRHLLMEEIIFESGRSFQVIEWIFPTHLEYRVNRPGLPAQNESAETLRITTGLGSDEIHIRDDNDDGSPRRIRHCRADRIKAERRARV